MRPSRRACLQSILEGSAASADAFRDLLEMGLKEAVEELETANENISMWRAQGKAQAMRALLDEMQGYGRG